MHILTSKHLQGIGEEYKDAVGELAAWAQLVKAAIWASFLDVRRTFADADAVDGYTVFNIRHNRYRLITVIHYAKAEKGTQGHIYIRSFLTHGQYNDRANWEKEYSNEHSTRKPH